MRAIHKKFRGRALIRGEILDVGLRACPYCVSNRVDGAGLSITYAGRADSMERPLRQTG